jgi:hypothetical protein
VVCFCFLDLAGTLVYSPKQRALAEIRNIRIGKLSPVFAYAAISDCLRTYMFGRFNINAPEMTTGELMDSSRMLEYADLVKFANAQPGDRATKQLLDAAEKWVETVELARDEVTA